MHPLFCLQILGKEGDAKLLLCAPQGYSADLLASALGAAGLKPTEMLRLADPRHPPVQMKEVRRNHPFMGSSCSQT